MPSTMLGSLDAMVSETIMALLSRSLPPREGMDINQMVTQINNVITNMITTKKKKKHQNENFCAVTNHIQRIKKISYRPGENTLAKDSYIGYIRNTQNFAGMKTSSPVRKWAKEKNRHFTKENIQMVNKHVKIWSTLLTIREMQIKSMMGYPSIRLRIARIKIVTVPNVW